jgi:hypothetical protein
MTPLKHFLHLKTCPKLKVNIFRFKMQNDLIWTGPTIKWQKSPLHRRKKPKIDLREVTGYAQMQAIERPDKGKAKENAFSI